jgi:hypothetical protein
MVAKTFTWMAALAVVMSACSSAGTEPGSSSPETTAAAPPTETSVSTTASTSTIPPTTSTVSVTTTAAVSTSSSSTTSTTSEPPKEVNPQDVETWWCDAFRAAAGQDPADFARGLTDDFRHGYTDVPADTIEEAAGQAALVVCDPEYGRAVADALAG